MATRLITTTRPRGSNVRAAFPVGLNYVTRWGVVEHFKLNEAGTGSRVGSIVPYTLTNNGAATQGAALAAGLSNSTDFSGTGQFLNVTNAAAPLLAASDVDMIFFGFIVIDDKSIIRYAWHKGTGITALTQEFSLSYQNTPDRFRLTWGDGAGAALTNAESNVLGSPVAGTPYFVLGYHDSVNNLLGIRTNGGAATTTSTAGRVPAATGGAFSIGERPGANRWDGRQSDVTICKSPSIGLAAAIAEIESVVYFGGTGKVYPWT